MTTRELVSVLQELSKARHHLEYVLRVFPDFDPDLATLKLGVSKRIDVCRRRLATKRKHKEQKK